LEADLIVHVRDVSHPDTEAQRCDVESVLLDLGLDEAMTADGIEVANKSDLLDDEELAYWQARSARPDGPVTISAINGQGINVLLERIDQALSAKHRHIQVLIPHSDGRLLSWLYDKGQVDRREDTDDGVSLRVLLSPDDLARWDMLYNEQYGDTVDDD